MITTIACKKFILEASIVGVILLHQLMFYMCWVTAVSGIEYAKHSVPLWLSMAPFATLFTSSILLVVVLLLFNPQEKKHNESTK